MEEKMALVDKFLYLDGECNFKKAELFHKNYKDAVKFYKRSYDNFKEAYSLMLAFTHKPEEEIPEIARIIERIRELGEKGVAEAILLRAEIEPMSKVEKLKLYENAAKIKYAAAVFRLARVYFNSKDDERDAIYYLKLLNERCFCELGSYEENLRFEEYDYEKDV